jgi:hypothetical protein
MDEILWWNNVCAHGLQDGKVSLDELHVVSGGARECDGI